MYPFRFSGQRSTNMGLQVIFGFPLYPPRLMGLQRKGIKMIERGDAFGVSSAASRLVSHPAALAGGGLAGNGLREILHFPAERRNDLHGLRAV